MLPAPSDGKDVRANELAERTATRVWRNGDKAEALGTLVACGYTPEDLRAFLGALGFGPAVAWSLIHKFA